MTTERLMRRPGTLADFCEEMRVETKSFDRYVDFHANAGELYERLPFLEALALDAHAFYLTAMEHGDWIVFRETAEGMQQVADLDEVCEAWRQETAKNDKDYRELDESLHPAYEKLPWLKPMALDAIAFCNMMDNNGECVLAGDAETIKRHAKETDGDEPAELQAIVEKIRAAMGG